MHDIGKIGIPDEILLKPGPLTEAEREIMKKHTLIGASILEGATSRFVVMGRTIALTHHERWDGKGYPNGLKGIDIPLVGRIVAIADVFDALASKRPYKEALPLEESFATVKECRETYFDPDVVDAFFAAQEEICAIRRHYVE
jgi:putative two-component system response regulator